MRSKRLLAVLLAFCLAFTTLAPAASAVEAPRDSVVNVQQNTDGDAAATAPDASATESGLVVSGDGAVSDGVPTLRGSLTSVMEANGSESNWDITPIDGKPNVDLTFSETPACIEELRKAAEVFAADETVTAFVVMEDQPLAETHTHISQVSVEAERILIEKQDTVISAIQKTVTPGEELVVRYQFTYLTNAFTIETEFANLEKIAALDGVKSVFIVPVYSACAAIPNTAASGAMVGVDTVWEDLGYTGEGMTIAILDTGLDMDHPSFAAAPANPAWDASYIADKLASLNAYAVYPGLTVNDVYHSGKVPFAFNYGDGGHLRVDHSDGVGDHGTHVAGIAAANPLESTTVVGMAPDAQIIVLKVFSVSGGAYMDDIVAALEDAMTLGCDVTNASLGSAAGFSSSDTEIDEIYERLNDQDIVAVFSAGNEGTSSYDNMWGTDLNRTQNPDNATVGSPSTYVNSFSIASAENGVVMTNYFALADNTKIFYMDSIEYLYGETYACMAGLAGEELEYVIIDGLGAKENFYDADGNSLVEGKVAVVKRGDLSFHEKAVNAEKAGAVACIIWNSNDTDDIFSFGMTTAGDDGYIPGIPVSLITLSSGQLMADAETKMMYPTEELGERIAEGGQMSSFSSWGVAPDLKLVPDITGIGGNVYSCYDNGQYGLMSGTSMSAPQIAGISALVMQRLQELYPNAPAGTIRELAIAMMMSTADPIHENMYAGNEASPRQQGAGLIDAAEAVSAEAYLTVKGNRPKAELGDGVSGTYTFSFEVHNISAEEKSYTLASSLLSEAVADYGIGVPFMAGFDLSLTGDVTFDVDTVIVPAGGSTTVNATITLGADDIAYFNNYWKNGGYVEGYVYLCNEEGEAELNLPFLGFYGDWTQAPVFDSAYWYQNGFWGAGSGWPEGDQYYHTVWTNLAGSDWVLGFNPYSGPVADENGNIIYDPANNSVSPNGDGVIDGIDDMYISLLRNAKTMTFNYSVDGETVYEQTYINNSKTMYMSNYGQIVPWLLSWYDYPYNFTDESGKVLPSGTEVLLTIDANVDYGTGGNHTMQIPITVDTVAPEILGAMEYVDEDGTPYLIIEIADDVSVAAAFLMNASGTQIYAETYDVLMEATEDGTMLCAFDVSELGTELTVCVGDYAGNENYYTVTYTAAGDNLPDMDTDMLYAYRVYDEYIMSDHMYGWVQLSKPAAAADEEGNALYSQVGVWTDDYMEYAAINAAEYVGGKIFAVDAVYNLIVMNPGLFDRRVVTNLGVNVLDMTFDDSTDTMYVLSKEDSNCNLYTMDLLTGELTLLHEYGYYYYAPFAIADNDNGTLYAIQYNKSTIMTIDAAGGNYDMVSTDVEILDSTGSAVKPSANSQSMTWIDGTLYWAYFRYTYYGNVADLITINTSDWSSYANTYQAFGYDSEDNLIDYYPESEFVGLISLNETDYQIPEATEASSISLNADQLIMAVGTSNELTASWLPWNYDLDESQLVWSSADESVATVDGGIVTAVAEGTTTVTVSYGDLTATCNVVVVNIEGSFNAYNYYSGDGYYGYMIEVDLQTLEYYLNNLSPVDFMAGDYNGHDGYFYGYDQGGQLYRYDLVNNAVTPLGAPMGTYPVDMAYDYSTGMMYALVLDYNTYENTLYAVNMSNGALMNMGVGSGLLTLACSTDGTLYAADAYGYLNVLYVVDYGFGPMLAAEPVMDHSFGELFYLQSMCWDHNNDVLLWTCLENATVYWIDPLAETPYFVSLGDPTGSGVVEFVGMYVIPEEIPELAETAVESVTGEDMMILTGYEKVPAITVAPFNATCQNLVLTSADETIVSVTESGTLLGVSAGATTVTGTLEDTVSGETFEVTINVTVMEGCDNLYGHLLTDLSNYGGMAWIELYPGNPAQYDILSFFDYQIYTAEYYDGKIYTYGFDPNDWEANWQYFVLDAENYDILSQTDMGEAFPYIYDMTYDYATSTMYALAGNSEDDTNLYVINMETGAITMLMDVEPLLMSIAAGPDGKLYAIENSREEYDPLEWTTTVTNAMLYSIDPMVGELTLVGDTGLYCNMIASMTFDYDTDAMYWTPLMNGMSIESHLAILDLETGAANSLGTIGSIGAQVGGLYTICDAYPEEDTSVLLNLLLASEKMNILVGQTDTVDVITMPAVIEGLEISFASADETVAAVDENGVVTGIAQGTTEITVTATVGDVTKTAVCTVGVLAADASFLTYNVTDMGWAEISRSDYTLVTNLNEGEEVAVATFTSVYGDVYGYDENNQLFKLDLETYERTNIGDGLGLEVDTEGGFAFEIRDMDYDVKNDRVLVLGATMLYDADFDEYSEIYDGCAIYTVDLETGELTLLRTLVDVVYIFSITADNDGNVYYYSTFMDDVIKLNLESGVETTLISLQRQSIYGDYNYDYSLHYDELTGLLYMLHSTNGRFYKMLTIDATLGTLTDGGYVGEIYEEDWAYWGDYFVGLTFLEEKAEEVPSDVEWAGASLSLNGLIKLNFYASLSEEFLNDPDAFIRFTFNGEYQDVPVADGILDTSDNTYRYSFAMNAKNMGDDVTAQFYNAEGVVGAAKTLSVKDYADFAIANSSKETLVNLMKAMLNYGAAAQVEFDYKVDQLVNADLSEEEKALPESVDVSAYAHKVTGSDEDITLTGASLLLQSSTKIRVYFTLAEGKSVSDYTFTVNGTAVTPVKTASGEYYIEKTSISSKNLDDMFTFKLGGLTLAYSGLSYVNQVQNGYSDDVNLYNMVKALYLYNQAANAYFV